VPGGTAGELEGVVAVEVDVLVGERGDVLDLIGGDQLTGAAEFVAQQVDALQQLTDLLGQLVDQLVLVEVLDCRLISGCRRERRASAPVLTIRPAVSLWRMHDRVFTSADTVYLAIGRFVVEFSQFVENLREGLIGVAQGTTEYREDDLRTALEIVTTEMTADPLQNLFFATCSVLCILDDGERRIRDILAIRARDLIKERNEIQHGFWILAAVSPGEPARFDLPLRVYDRLSRKEGIAHRGKELTIPDLEALADEADEMRRLIAKFAQGCAQQREHVSLGVREYFELQGDRLVERNPPPPASTGK
jgi:hypothetical protein